MRRGGIGGSHTLTGLKFERDTNVLDIFMKIRGFDVRGNKVFKANKLVAESYPKESLYKYLASKNVNYRKILSAKILPDDSLFILKTNTFFIFEKKFQEVSGSTDEKLQTCGFKILQYKKLLKSLNCKVMFVYILNDWFRKPRYKDVLDFIRSVDNCRYFFNVVPLNMLGI